MCVCVRVIPTTESRAQDEDVPSTLNAVDSGVLQRVAVCCSVLQCVAMLYFSAIQCEEDIHSTLFVTLVCCSVLQCVAVCCSVLQCVAVCCSALQCVAVRCSVRRIYLALLLQ